MRSLGLILFVICGLRAEDALVAQVSKSPAAVMSVCELARLPKRNGEVVVRVKSLYITDLRHGVLFKDPSCPEINIYRFDNPGVSSESLRSFDAEVESFYFSGLSDYTVEFSAGFYTDIAGLPGGKIAMEEDASRGLPRVTGGLVIKDVYRFKRHSAGDDDFFIPKLAF